MPGLFLTESERARLSNFPDEIAANDVIGFFTLTASDKKRLPMTPPSEGSRSVMHLGCAAYAGIKS
jgi:hypothetical protein